jgi:hypothetical protein
MKKIYAFAVIGLVIASCGGEETVSMNEEESVLEESSLDENIEEKVLLDIYLTKIEELPETCEFDGKMIDAYRWDDENGANYFIRTIGELQEGKPKYTDEAGMTQYLYAYHYIKSADGEMTLSRAITDFVKDCEFDLNMGHELDALTLTDLNKDNIGEVAFIYRTTCTSDVSPSTQKLIMLEDGEKFALRGTTQVMGDGGDYEVGEGFKSAPEEFLSHAKQLWSEHLTEYDFEL